MTKLDKCPNVLCGSEDVHVNGYDKPVSDKIGWNGKPVSDVYYRAFCDDCGLEVDNYADEDELIAYWNDRPQTINVDYLIWNYLEAIRDSLETSDPVMAREVDLAIVEIRSGNYSTEYGGYHATAD